MQPRIQNCTWLKKTGSLRSEKPIIVIVVHTMSQSSLERDETFT